MGTLKEYLMSEAREKGICLDGFKQMRSDDRDGLIDYYVSNPDWCLERGFPDLHTLSESFADCEGKGVYVNRTLDGETFSELQVYVFHNCKGRIKVAMDYKKELIPMLYFANGCNMVIECTQDNGAFPIRVPIYEFGENNIQANDNMNIRFVRYKNDLI